MLKPSTCSAGARAARPAAVPTAYAGRTAYTLPRCMHALHVPQELRETLRPAAARMQPRAALAGSAGPEHNNSQKLSDYLKLARIHNMIPSMLLVVVGAYAGAGHRMAAVQSSAVLVMSLISGSLAVASVVVNDYFDLKLDATNAPDKPLPSGAIAPDAALLLSSLLYCSCLIAACLMEPSRLRSIVAFSAGATLLYTPLFKRLTAIKNATVATVIALAPLAGALAAGAGDAGLLRLVPATLFAFSGVMYREILMDLNDAEGDAAAGVRTLPVLFGKPRALLCALAFLLLGSGVAAARLLMAWGPAAAAAGSEAGGLVQWLAAGLTNLGAAGVVSQQQQAAAVADLAGQLAAGLPLIVLLAAAGRLLALAWQVWRSGFDEKEVGRAVDECLKPIGSGIIMLAALG